MDWSTVGLQVAQFLLPILGTVLSALAVVAAKKLVSYLGLKENAQIDAMIDRYVEVGVNHAQKAASKLIDTKMPSKDKLNLAVTTVLRELEESGVKGVAHELIEARIEAYLIGNPLPKLSGVTA
jgi:hypothetical protein